MSKKLLIHSCCAPCTCFPLEILKSEDYDITLYWYNPNIHGYDEYQKRRMAMGYYVSLLKGIELIEEDYRPEDWFASNPINDKDRRCEFCYRMRLENTVKLAKEKGFDIFTSTLLYSKFQNHELIKDMGYNLAEDFGVEFLYEDFRSGWKKGIQISKQLGLYRQRYCGCLFSEMDR